MKKGFLHIIEIILVSLLMFFVISQFTYLPPIKSDWPMTKLYLQGNDIISTLDIKGVEWSNTEEVITEINTTLPKNIEYGLKLKNIIKPEIRVGCICNNTEYSDIFQVLTTPPSMTINGHTIKFILEQIDTDSPIFSVKNDVIIIREAAFTNIEGNDDYKDEMLAYLSTDRGVIEIVNMNNTRANDEFQNNIFNLKWESSLMPNSNDIEFSTTFGEYSLKPPIEKYFYHFPNGTGDFYEKPHTFEDFLGDEKVYAYDDIREKIILSQPSSGVPASIINYNVAKNKGRTVWLSEPYPVRDDTGILIKALTAWTAGDIYDVATGYFQEGKTVSFSFFKVLNEDMYQPIEILFTLGYLYAYGE